jgi:hypothetical protein
MHRWYCAECRTPIGNAMSAGVPFVGLIHCFMDHASDERTRDELLGPPYYSQGKFAAAGLPKERQGVPWGAIKKSASLLGKWWLGGAGTPSPLFVGEQRAPRVTPRVLTPEQRQAL